jgi:hypothetical protein
LIGPERPIVFVAFDWCEIRNGTYDEYRQLIAEVAGTTPERVLLASVHQHDAPVVDYDAQNLLDAAALPNSLCDINFAELAIHQVAGVLHESLKDTKPVTHYGIGEAEVKDVASNRRVLSTDGKVTFARGSATADPAIRDQSAGTIDPILKTLSFWNGDTPVAAISAYATHPMSYYGKGGVSADFVGMARAKRRAETPDVFQMYFTGCAGDVTAGKWNDGNPANRPVLAEKIHQGMVDAWKATKRHPLGAITVRSADLVLEPKETNGYSADDAHRTLADTSAKPFDRNLAAMGLSWRARIAHKEPIAVIAVDFGKAQFLLMPAESFVQYQLSAQKARPDQFIITAGYGECAPGYIPTASATEEGFNADKWCWVAPGAEPRMIEAIRKALDAK